MAENMPIVGRRAYAFWIERIFFEMVDKNNEKM